MSLCETNRFAAWICAAILLAAPIKGAALERSQTLIDPTLESQVRQDIVELHEFFVGWYNGELPHSAYASEFEARLDPAFTIVMPSGVELDLPSLSVAMKASLGQKPGFRIEIRNVRLKHVAGTTVVATYEEWQRNSGNEPGRGSGRFSTVVMERVDSLKWLHVHETWLPQDVVASDEFNF